MGGIKARVDLTNIGPPTERNSFTQNKIILNDVDMPTDAGADGGGLCLLGDTGDKTILWDAATDRWVINRTVSTPGMRLTATDDVLTLNRLTTVQRDALSPFVDDGSVIYNTDTNLAEIKESGLWVSREPAIEKTVYVFNESDIPTPLAVDTNYRIRASIAMSGEIIVPANSSNSIIIEGPFSIIYLGTGTFVTGTDFNNISFKGDSQGQLIAFDPSATLYDVSTANVNSFVVLEDIFIIGWSDLGRVEVLGIGIDETVFAFCGQGLTMNTTFINIAISFWLDGLDVEGTVFTVECSQSVMGRFFSFNAVLAASETFLDIRPDILPTSALVIVDNTISGGTFYKTDATGVITNIADASVSGSILSVSDDGSGSARFGTGAAHGMFVGQEVINVGCADPTYNGTFLITNVNSATSYDISSITFNLTDTGTFSSDSVTVTSTAHGLLDGAALLIKDTVNYNGGANIYNSLANTYQINRLFVSVETVGEWDTGSLDETDRRITSKDNSGQKDSQSIGSANTNHNAAVTIITTPGDWEDFNLTGAVKSSNIELWTLVNPITGELRYDGVEPFSGVLNASISASSAGSSNEFHFRVVKNGLELPDQIETAIEIGSDLATCGLVVPINAVTGDLVRPQVQNDDGTSNIIIKFFSENIQ